MKLGGNRPPGLYALLFSISGRGSFIYPVTQTRLDIARPRMFLLKLQADVSSLSASRGVVRNRSVWRVLAAPVLIFWRRSPFLRTCHLLLFVNTIHVTPRQETNWVIWGSECMGSRVKDRIGECGGDQLRFKVKPSQA